MEIMREGWTNPADEFLGVDDEGREYFRFGTQVCSRQDGYTQWLCTVAAFPLFLKLHDTDGRLSIIVA